MKIFTIGKTSVYATPTGVKIGTRGKVQSVVDCLSKFDKSIRRRIRVSLAENGYRCHASAR